MESYSLVNSAEGYSQRVNQGKISGVMVATLRAPVEESTLRTEFIRLQVV